MVPYLSGDDRWNEGVEPSVFRNIGVFFTTHINDIHKIDGENRYTTKS